MQAIYFPTHYFNVKKDEDFYLKCSHDEYSLWFNVSIDESYLKDDTKPITLSLVSRNRLLQINDKKHNEIFLNAFKKV